MISWNDPVVLVCGVIAVGYLIICIFAAISYRDFSRFHVIIGKMRSGVANVMKTTKLYFSGAADDSNKIPPESS